MEHRQLMCQQHVRTVYLPFYGRTRAQVQTRRGSRAAIILRIQLRATLKTRELRFHANVSRNQLDLVQIKGIKTCRRPKHACVAGKATILLM